MSRSLVVVFAVLLLHTIAIPRPAEAAWPHEPYNANTPVCMAAGGQYAPTSVSDGAGGMIVTWYDFRNGVDHDIYAQHISAAGLPLWTADGVVVCAAAGVQNIPILVSDGAGGAIVTWQDARGNPNYDVYAQRIDASGVVQWAADGVLVCGADLNQFSAAIVSDGAGGAILSWEDYRVGVADIYAQRIDATGAPQWTADGVLLCGWPGNQRFPTMTADGAGGAIVAWYDYRNGPYLDLFAQRVSALGVPLWTANGAAVCTAASYQEAPMLITDGVGGAIVVWMDYRNGTNYDLYAQHLNSATGVGWWATDGVVVCNAAGSQDTPVLVADGAGGAIVAWSDTRGGSIDIYAQRISITGASQWTANGVALCSAARDQFGPRILPAAGAGAIVVWADERNGTYVPDLYAQRVGASGATQWEAQGVALCTSLFAQSSHTMASDGAGGVIVAWQDFRAEGNSGTPDIFAQRIEQFGKLGSPEPVIASVLDVPNDQGGRVRLAWEASYLDGESNPDFTAYDIFRSIPPNLARAALARGDSRELRLGEVPADGARSYLLTDFGVHQLAWEYVSTATAQHYIATYGSTQGTAGDSTANANPTTSFMVVGRNSGGSKCWLSLPASGYSVDNLAPAAPAPLTGQYAAGTTRLHWNRNTEADLAGYRLYRGHSASFTPDASNLVGALPDTGYADIAGSPYVYKLTAIDSHGNESPVATLVLSGMLDVGSAPSALTFAAPSPNPARGATTLRWTTSRAGHVRMSVYDAAGRRVVLLRDGDQEAGAHSQSFALRDAAGRELASGLYLLQLEAEGRVLTRRLATIR